MKPGAIVEALLDGQDDSAAALNWQAKPVRPSPPVQVTPVSENRNPFKRKPKKVVVTEQAEPPPEPAPQPEPEPEAIVEELAPPPQPPPEPEPVAERITLVPPTAPSPRDVAESEIVDLILRAQRVAKSTGAPLEVCLEELRRQLKPPAVEPPAKSKVRRFEFQSSPDGLLTGAKLIEE